MLHNQRDKHHFNTNQNIENKYWVRIIVSEAVTKHFKFIKAHNNEFEAFTMTYTASRLISQSMKIIEELLTGLVIEIKRDSYWGNNLYKPKTNNDLVIVSVEPGTNKASPVSDSMWETFLKGK